MLLCILKWYIILYLHTPAPKNHKKYALVPKYDSLPLNAVILVYRYQLKRANINVLQTISNTGQYSTTSKRHIGHISDSKDNTTKSVQSSWECVASVTTEHQTKPSRKWVMLFSKVSSMSIIIKYKRLWKYFTSKESKKPWQLYITIGLTGRGVKAKHRVKSKKKLKYWW